MASLASVILGYGSNAFVRPRAMKGVLTAGGTASCQSLIPTVRDRSRDTPHQHEKGASPISLESRKPREHKVLLLLFPYAVAIAGALVATRARQGKRATIGTQITTEARWVEAKESQKLWWWRKWRYRGGVCRPSPRSVRRQEKAPFVQHLKCSKALPISSQILNTNAFACQVKTCKTLSRKQSKTA